MNTLLQVGLLKPHAGPCVLSLFAGTFPLLPVASLGLFFLTSPKSDFIPAFI